MLRFENIWRKWSAVYGDEYVEIEGDGGTLDLTFWLSQDAYYTYTMNVQSVEENKINTVITNIDSPSFEDAKQEDVEKMINSIKGQEVPIRLKGEYMSVREGSSRYPFLYSKTTDTAEEWLDKHDERMDVEMAFENESQPDFSLDNHPEVVERLVGEWRAYDAWTRVDSE